MPCGSEMSPGSAAGPTSATNSTPGVEAAGFGMGDVDRAVDRDPSSDRRAVTENRLGSDRSDHLMEVMSGDLFWRQSRAHDVQSSGEPLCLAGLCQPTRTAVVGLGRRDELTVRRCRRTFHR